VAGGGDNDVEVFFNLILLEGTSPLHLHWERGKTVPGETFFSVPLERVRAELRAWLKRHKSASDATMN
jgi:hypothetical protein